MLQRVSGTTLHFPDTVYGLSLKAIVICGAELFGSELFGAELFVDQNYQGSELFGPNLPQVGKMRRKLGPLPSQVVRLNPGQSRSERHAWKFHVVNWFELNWICFTFEGGPRKREKAGDARRRVRKRTIFLFVDESSACVKTGWKRWNPFSI